MKKRKKKKMSISIILGVFIISISAHSQASIYDAKAALADHAVINEVQVDSVPGTGGTDDDWAEIFNPTASDISLAGWSIQKYSGSTLSRQALSGTVSAGGYFLIVKNGATTAQALKDAADLLVAGSFDLANNNSVFLVNDNINITDINDPNIVDFVGFGTSARFEGAAAAPGIAEGKSIARVPAGEDTNDNSRDFVLQDIPTPQNSSSGGGSNVGGTVLLTLTPDATPVQEITTASARIVFSVNSAGTAIVNYGQTAVYGSVTSPEEVAENIAESISLTGLQCGTIYHYSVHAENSAATESDNTQDAVFTTLPCGIKLDSLIMTRAGAKANNAYADGWAWEFSLTVWDMNETSLKMKFSQWSGAGSLNAGGNMEFSVDSGADWIAIVDNGSYSPGSADLSSIDLSADAGRQVKIMVRMKVPFGTRAGVYNSSYGILTE